MFHMQPKYSTFHIFIYFDLKSLPSPVSCGSMECLNAQRCLLAPPQSSSQTRLFFRHHGCSVHCFLGSPTAVSPSPFLCAYTETCVLASKQLKKVSLRLFRETEKKRGLHACPWIKKHKNKKKGALHKLRCEGQMLGGSPDF